MSIEVKCGVSSCNLFRTHRSQNCYSVNDVSNCRLFTQEREEPEIEEEEIEAVVDGGSEAGTVRKIYF